MLKECVPKIWISTGVGREDAPESPLVRPDFRKFDEYI